MPPYTVQPCTYTDAVSIAENNVPAFWLDAAWVLIWTRVHKTCSYVTSQSALRSPQNLLSDPEHRRHEKVVDGETGKLVGYCRWLLPNDLGDGVRSEEVWNEARIGVEDGGLAVFFFIASCQKGVFGEADVREDKGLL